ncbi:MAG: hypothetical protein MUE69_05935 [Myxococcota bacterium]|nr:hypothetical protein [Myxococcota bacterium]
MTLRADAGSSDAGSMDAGDAGEEPVDAGEDAGEDGGSVDAGVDAGGCPVECASAENALSTGCDGARCTIETCAAGFDDCDGAFANGCEVELENDPSHCGVCGRSCGLGGSCEASICDRPERLSLGVVHLCVTREGGAVLCAGRNESGQLGRGTLETTTRPFEAVSGLMDALGVWVGGANTCVSRESAVSCMGDGAFGQNGDGTNTSRTRPVVVSGSTSVDELVVGGDYSRLGIGIPSSVPRDGFACSRTAGTVECWGHEAFRGDGGTGNTNTPVTVTAFSDAISMAAGPSHVCAVRLGGEVWCWGRAGAWLGANGTVSTNVPVVVPGITDAVSVAAGSQHTCAIRADRSVMCWGVATDGRLGVDLGATTSSPTPVIVAGLDQVRALALGRRHSCALRTGGSVRCWGANDLGQLGDGRASAGGPTPLTVAGLTATTIAASELGTCAIREDGSVACWGNGAIAFGITGDPSEWLEPTEHPVFPPVP